MGHIKIHRFHLSSHAIIKSHLCQFFRQITGNADPVFKHQIHNSKIVIIYICKINILLNCLITYHFIIIDIFDTYKIEDVRD